MQIAATLLLTCLNKFSVSYPAGVPGCIINDHDPGEWFPRVQNWEI
jgi:hypothetical protein